MKSGYHYHCTVVHSPGSLCPASRRSSEARSNLIKYDARLTSHQSSEVMADALPDYTDDHYLIFCLPDRREIACYSIPCTLSPELQEICREHLTGLLTTADVPFNSELVTEILHSDAPWQPSITIPAAPNQLLPPPVVPPLAVAIPPDSPSEPESNSAFSPQLPYQDGVTHHLSIHARFLPSPTESDLSFLFPSNPSSVDSELNPISSPYHSPSRSPQYESSSPRSESA